MSRNVGTLKPYAFNFAVTHGRDYQMTLKGLQVKHQKLYLYLQISSPFPALLDDIIECYIVFENHIVDLKKKLSKKVDI